MYLCSIKFLLKSISHIYNQSRLILKGLGLYGSTTRPTTLFLWSRPLSWTPRRIISSPAILMAYSALESWYVSCTSINPNFNQTLRLPLVRIHVDCRPYFQAFFRGSVLFRLVKPVSNSGHTVFPTGNILASSLSRVTSSSWWDGGVALLL